MSLIRGDRIITLRGAKGLNQKQLAELLDVSPNQVSKYELGKGEPSVEVLIKLAEKLDTTADYLLGLTHDAAKQPITTLTELEYEVLSLIQNRDDTFVEKLVAILKII